MLEEMATVGEESIVSWQPHGRAFRVHLPDVFARNVMPRYFKKQTKYKSFLRQLHIYGFHRICKGMDRGAYYHDMFIRNKKSMSLRMSCQKIKGRKSTTSNVAHHHATVNPDLSSWETTYVDNDQFQERRNLPYALQVDPMLQTHTTIKETKTAGNSYQHYPEEEEPLVNSAHLFNQEVSDGPSPPHYRLIGSDIIGLGDWMNQAEPTLLRDEEHASPHYECDSRVSEKGHETSATLYRVNHQKQGDEGFFAGKRFFYVVETGGGPMVEDFNAVINRRGPMFYVPRST
jgi:hypothetical protein